MNSFRGVSRVATREPVPCLETTFYSHDAGGVFACSVARYNGSVSILSKQRTREHIIADLSVNHAERQFLLAGYTGVRIIADYGYDITITTFDDLGHIEPGVIQVQMKSSDSPDYSQAGDFVTVRVNERDNIAWREELYPVVLIVYDAAKDVAFYIHYQTVPQSSRRSVRIPTSSHFDANAARQLRDAKTAAQKGRN